MSRGELRRWGGLVVQRYSQPSGESGVLPGPEHTFILHTGHALRLEQRRDGRVRDGLVVPGEVAVAGAHRPVYCRWEGEMGFVRMSLREAFIRRVADELELPGTDRLEIVGDFGTRDAQVERVGYSLASELKSEGLGGHLYAGSLANVLAVHLLRRYSNLRPGVASPSPNACSRVTSSSCR